MAYMHVRGQSGLDLLLSLLVLLIVLNVFSSVLVRFEEVQKEISIRQQLRENIFLMGTLTAYTSGKFSDIRVYPQTNNIPRSVDLTARLNAYSRSSGMIDLENIRSPGVQSRVPCTFAWDINLPVLNYSLLVLAADAGTPYDIDINRYVHVDENYDQNHSFVPQGCVDVFSVEAKP